MRDIWVLLIIGVATSFLSERIFISAQSPSSSSADDLYLEEQQSGDYPVDDDDQDSSGSGSGDSSHIEDIKEVVFSTKVAIATKVEPTQNTLTEATTLNPVTTAREGLSDHTSSIFRDQDRDFTEKELPDAEDVSEDWANIGTSPSPSPSTSTSTSTSSSTSSSSGTSSRASSSSAPSTTGGSIRMLDEKNSKIMEVHSENLFQRTEVLAAVIAGGVIGFLFAIFLILLLVYRMRKKDEGSYDLGERKPPPTAYQSAPTREFYA